MSDASVKSLEQVIAGVGRYPSDAFEFLRDGLDYSVQRLHGEPPEGWNTVVEWMHRHKVTADELRERFARRKLPVSVYTVLKGLGGPEALESRHVTGRQLCEGLRDLAMHRWGLLASAVLRQWNVTSTRDFGEMVFALVQADLLQKRPDDQIEDFDDVFAFDEAFDSGYRIHLP